LNQETLAGGDEWSTELPSHLSTGGHLLFLSGKELDQLPDDGVGPEAARPAEQFGLGSRNGLTAAS